MNKTIIALFLGMLMIMSAGLVILMPSGNVTKDNVIVYPIAPPSFKARGTEGTNLSQWGYVAYASSEYSSGSWNAMAARGLRTQRTHRTTTRPGRHPPRKAASSGSRSITFIL